MINDIKKQIFFVIIFFLTNIFFYAIASYLSVGRTLINADYSFVLLLIFFKRHLLAYIFLVLFMLVDAFMLLVQILPFARVIDFLYFIGRFEFINKAYVLNLSLLMFFIFVIAYAFVRIAKQALPITAIIFFNIIIFTFYALSFGVDEDSQANNRFYRVANVPFVDSVFLYAYNYRTTGFMNTYDLKDQKFEDSFAERAFCSQVGCDDITTSKKTLLILNESWGEYKNSSVNAHILSEILNDFNTVYSQSVFSGATVDAELKELCGLETNSFYLKEVTAQSLSNCLPNKFKEIGYETISYHGAGSGMYDRHHWYQKAGFDERYFYDNYDWKTRCYSFPGTCDSEISEKIKKDIKNVDTGFFYWLTLNTHHNYNLKDLKFDAFSCTDFDIKNPEICRNAKLQKQFFIFLKELLDEFKGDDLIVFVVGDHLPQVVNKEDKEFYFEEKTVPWIMIDLKR